MISRLTYGLRGEGLVRLIVGGGKSVVLYRGSNCLLSRAVDGCIMRRGTTSTPISCHFQDRETLHRAQVSSAAASSQTFAFTCTAAFS